MIHTTETKFTIGDGVSIKEYEGKRMITHVKCVLSSSGWVIHYAVNGAIGWIPEALITAWVEPVVCSMCDKAYADKLLWHWSSLVNPDYKKYLICRSCRTKRQAQPLRMEHTIFEILK